MVGVVAELGSCIIHPASYFLEGVGAGSRVLRWRGRYFEEVFLAEVGQFLLEGGSSLFEHGLVGLVVARAGDEAEDFGVLQGAAQHHFLHSHRSTSLPLPKEKPLPSSFLNSVPSS